MAIDVEAMKITKGTWESYKFFKDKKCVIPEGEIWWFDVIRMGQPKSTELNVNGRMVTAVKYTAQLRPKDKKNPEAERIWVELTGTAYTFLTETLKVKPLDTVGFQKTKIKLKTGNYVESLKMYKAKDKSDMVDSNTAGSIGAKSNTKYPTKSSEDIEVSDVDLEDLV